MGFVVIFSLNNTFTTPVAALQPVSLTALDLTGVGFGPPFHIFWEFGDSTTFDETAALFNGPPDPNTYSVTSGFITTTYPGPHPTHVKFHQYPLPPMAGTTVTFSAQAQFPDGFDIVNGFVSITHSGTSGGGVAPPLRLGQRNDGLGPTGHARLTGKSSVQLSNAPRVGGKNTYS